MAGNAKRSVFRPQTSLVVIFRTSNSTWGFNCFIDLEDSSFHWRTWNLDHKIFSLAPIKSTQFQSTYSRLLNSIQLYVLIYFNFMCMHKLKMFSRQIKHEHRMRGPKNRRIPLRCSRYISSHEFFVLLFFKGHNYPEKTDGVKKKNTVSQILSSNFPESSLPGLFVSSV